MSYALSPALQRAIFARLKADPTLIGLTGGTIFDSYPAGEVPPLYVALGPERVRDRSDKTGYAAQHDLTISVVTREPGFAIAKDVAAAVSDALVDAALPLSRGHLVGLRFLRANAARTGTNDTRRIDLIFRALVSGA